MKRLLLSISLMLAVVVTFGQELSKEELKAQKRQKKALMSLIGDAEAAIINDPTAALNTLKPALEGDQKDLVVNEPYLWYVSGLAKLGIMQQELIKQQEGAQFDQKKLFKYCYELFQDFTRCDSLDNLPDAKGKVKPQYSEQIKKVLYENRNHLFNGGAFFYNEEDFNMAYNMFDTFITSADMPRLAEFNLNSFPELAEISRLAAYYSALSGMRLENYNMVLKHMDLALQDSANAESAYQFKADALANLGDTVAWLDILKECSVKYPNSPYFHQSLIQYYNEKDKYDELTKFADDMIASDPGNPLFVYIKGLIPMRVENYDEAIVWFKKTLEIDPNYENAIVNLAASYMNKAHLYNSQQTSMNIKDKAKIKQDQEILKGYFSEALPLYEKLRSIAPDKTNLWLTGLYNCYYNLEMTDKMKEIESLMPQE